MKAHSLLSVFALSASLAMLCTSCETSRPPDRVEQASSQPSNDQVLTAQQPTQVLSANLSNQDLQVITTDHVQHAQFASLAEAPCDTCGNGIWKVFNLSEQPKLLVAFVALLVLSAALYLRYQRHNRTLTTH